MSATVRRKVIDKQMVYGYRGYPTLYLMLDCGHSKAFRGDMPWNRPQKTTICYDCTKAKRERAA